jgi:hypothetical protein
MWALLIELGLAAMLAFAAWRVWPQEPPTEPEHDD